MKKLLTIALVLMLLATGCGTGGNSQSSSQPVEPESTVPEVSVADPVEPEEPDEESLPEEEAAVDRLEGLLKDEYDGLTITAAVLERMAILPGAAVPVTVTIENTGDKTVFYTQGSGTSETPQALYAATDDLQPVIPKDNLGIMTMDFVTKELKPGENLKFVLYVMAIEPNDQFDTYTYDLYNADETYIAEMEWPTLQEQHTDLVAAQPGSYTIHVNFLYYLPEENGMGNPLGEPSGYAQAECVIGVS